MIPDNDNDPYVSLTTVVKRVAVIVAVMAIFSIAMRAISGFTLVDPVVSLILLVGATIFYLMARNRIE